MKISAVVIARNEEKNIQECLKFLKWCDEIIVIDDDSEDETVEIAENMGAKVFHRRLNGDFSAQRNFGLAKAKGDWVLFIDADERVTPKLKKEILQYTVVLEYGGFYLKRQDFFGGRALKYGETGKFKLLRLGKRKAGKWRRKVHEVWEVKGKVGTLGSPLIHHPHQTVTEFIKEVNFYSTIHAQQLHSENTKSNLFRIIVNPMAKFFLNYFFRLGFLDGMPGFIVAIMMSFHSFLARSKLYLL